MLAGAEDVSKRLRQTAPEQGMNPWFPVYAGVVVKVQCDCTVTLCVVACWLKKRRKRPAAVSVMNIPGRGMSDELKQVLGSSLLKAILITGVVCLPLQQLFTIGGSGNPIKIVELAFVTAAAVLALGLLRERPEKITPIVPLALLLSCSVLVSMLLKRADYPPGWVPSGYALPLEGDIVLYSLYAVFAMMIAVLMSLVLDFVTVARAVRYSVYVAGACCLVQLALWMVGLQVVYFALSGTYQLGQSFGASLPRNGPFLEGNYLALYAGCALFVCWRTKSRTAVGICVAMLLYSQSTAGMLSVAVAVPAAIALRGSWRMRAAFVGVVALLVCGSAFSGFAGTYMATQGSKLGLVESSGVEGADFSRENRYLTSVTGFRIGVHYPLLGVGSGRYGVHYEDHVDLSKTRSIFLVSGYSRPITNNAYSQIAAEHGLVGLALFGAILVAPLRVLRRSDAGVGMFIFFAFAMLTAPSWTVPTIWVFIGVMHTWADSAKPASRVEEETSEPKALPSGSPHQLTPA